MAMLLAACSSGTDEPQGDGLTPDVSMKQFDGPQACEQLEAAIETTVSEMMREQLERLAEYSGEVGVSPAPAPGGDSPTNDSSQDSRAESGGDSASYSETNVQVAGIDEPDTVKNDGRFLYTLGISNDQIKLSQVALRPPDNMVLLGSVRWPASASDGQTGNGGSNDTSPVAAPEYPVGLLLRSTEGSATPDELIALTSGTGLYAYPTPVIVGGEVADAASPTSICVDTGCGPGQPEWAPPRTVLRGYAVGDTTLASRWQLKLPGQYMTARRKGNQAYVITQATLQLPEAIRWWPDDAASRASGWRTAVLALISSNEQIIRDAELAHWLAPLRGDTAGAPTAAECSTFSTPDVGSRLSWTRIHQINLNTQAVSSHTVMSNGQAFYMNADALIITSPYWAREPNRAWFDAGSGTLIHRFSIDDSTALRYEASGALTGRLINRFAIDEKDGVIRLAMSRFSRSAPYSYLATLGNQEGRLQVLGKTDRIAPGETLESARFVGDRAYLVTFEVIDPFFVFDLSDAANPVTLGELKIPGFSSYLHPVGENHVLGIGYDSGNWPRRIKASLFDVSNPSAPIEQSVLLLGESYTYSDALWDPHAFTYYRPDPQQADGIMAIPFRSFAWPEYGTRNETGIRLVNVQAAQGAQGLMLRGTLEMSDLLDNATDGWRTADARRAVFVDRDVYGVADGVIRSAGIDQPENPLDTLVLP